MTVHDLAAASTDGRFDVGREQQLLLDHDQVVWQFPWYWYSVPAVLKAWMDQVLTYGFAYGQDGTALRGKSLQLVTSTGRPVRVLPAGRSQPVHDAGTAAPPRGDGAPVRARAARPPGAAGRPDDARRLSWWSTPSDYGRLLRRATRATAA